MENILRYKQNKYLSLFSSTAKDQISWSKQKKIFEVESVCEYSYCWKDTWNDVIEQ